MGSLVSFISRHKNISNPPRAEKSAKPIRLGIMSAARIAREGVIDPSRSHPDIVLAAIASRDPKKAQQFAKKHGIPTAYSGTDAYQKLLDDKEIDAVYIALPNAFHYEWTLKALAAHKHVLLEKPSCHTSDETRKLFEYAQAQNLILLEAAHYRFHPAIQRVKQIIDSKELGEIKSLEAELSLPKGFILQKDDIRYNYAVGGGALQDMGYYPLSCMRYLMSANPTEVVSARADIRPQDTKVDTAMFATLLFEKGVTAELRADYHLKKHFGIIPHFPITNVVVQLTKGEIELSNFPVPHVMHKIMIKPKNGTNRTESAYTFADKGKPWWTSYRYQLEAFADKIKGREPQTWIYEDDSVDQAHWVENIYHKAGLPSRPTSTFVFKA